MGSFFADFLGLYPKLRLPPVRAVIFTTVHMECSEHDMVDAEHVFQSLDPHSTGAMHGNCTKLCEGPFSGTTETCSCQG